MKIITGELNGESDNFIIDFYKEMELKASY